MYIWCFNFNKHGRRSPPGLLGGWSPSLALEPCPGRAAPPERPKIWNLLKFYKYISNLYNIQLNIYIYIYTVYIYVYIYTRFRLKVVLDCFNDPTGSHTLGGSSPHTPGLALFCWPFCAGASGTFTASLELCRFWASRHLLCCL